MEAIVQRKLQIYKELQTKLLDFKQQLREEEDMHNKTVGKGFK